MASSIARAAAAAACLALLAVAETPSAGAFDPPFAFPAFEKVKGAEPPTEATFVKGCFSYVYGLLHQSNKELYKKPAELPDVVMKSCRQEDKKGCHRFAQQLQKIVEAKTKEGPIGHMRHSKAKAAQKAGKATKVEKVEKKVEKVEEKVEKKVETVAKVEKKDEEVQKVEKKDVKKVQQAKPVPPPAQKQHKRKPGARVKQEDLKDENESFLQLDAEVVRQPLAAFAQDFANFGIDGASAVAEGRKSVQEGPPAGFAPDYALLGLTEEADAPKEIVAKVEQKVVKKVEIVAKVEKKEEKKQLGLVAQETQRRPLRYNEWCSNLYTVATSTYDPTKAKKAEPPAKVEKVEKKVEKASPKPFAANATNTTVMANVKSVQNATLHAIKAVKVATNATAAKAIKKA